MVELARAAVFSGGKPGIRDELELFRKRHPDAPAYLVGGAGGETARLIDEAKDPDREKTGLEGEALRILHESRDEHLVAALIALDLTRRGRSEATELPTMRRG